MSRSRLSEVAVWASVVAAGCTFLGWGRSGRSVRSSYGLFEAAGRAGLLPESIEQVGWLFFFVPALAGAALLAHAIDRPRAAALLSLIIGTATTGATLLVVLSPLSVQTPAIIAGVAGMLAAITAGLALAANRGRGEREQ